MPAPGLSESRALWRPTNVMCDQFRLLAHRLFNRPLAIHPARAQAITDELAGQRRIGEALAYGAGMKAPCPTPPAQAPIVTPDGVAVVRVSGLLVQRWHPMSEEGVTGLDWLRAQLILAFSDPKVRAIVMDIDSFGGEVAGTFDLVDMIHAARGMKPVWAILTEEAYSGAYALASAADRIMIPRTGGAGSIGVIAMVLEMYRALHKAGTTVHPIRHGERKDEINEFEPLSDDARARLQARVDACGALFVETVARNRGLRPRAIRALQAGTFLGPDSVRLGLADAVSAPDQAYEALVASL